jgi:hypothetical protein
MTIIEALFYVVAIIALYFWVLWCIRPRFPGGAAVDHARVDREMWGELHRLSDRAGRARLSETSAEEVGAQASPELAAESLSEPRSTPRQLGRAHIRVVKPPRQTFVPWDGKTH